MAAGTVLAAGVAIVVLMPRQPENLRPHVATDTKPSLEPKPATAEGRRVPRFAAAEPPARPNGIEQTERRPRP